MLVIASAVIFAALAVKSKSVRSFNFQFSVFMLLWAAAEVPAVLSAAGVIATTAYENEGLALHLFSMFLFGLFVALRGRSSFGEMRLSQITGRAAYSGVSKVIEEVGAKALGFYLDYGSVDKDPKRFDLTLRKIFAEGSDTIEKSIVDELYSKAGLKRDPAEDSDFAAAINRVKAAAQKI